MAELDLRSPPSWPYFTSATLSATPGQVRRVLLPTSGPVMVTLRPEATAAKMLDASVCPADNVSDSGLATWPLDAGTATEVIVEGNNHGAVIGLSSTTASQVVYIAIEHVTVLS